MDQYLFPAYLKMDIKTITAGYNKRGDDRPGEDTAVTVCFVIRTSNYPESSEFEQVSIKSMEISGYSNTVEGNAYSFLRRSSSSDYIRRELNSLHNRPEPLLRTFSIGDVSSFLKPTNRYKPKQSFSLPFVRQNYPFLICRDHFSHCDYSRNRAYIPFAPRYKRPPYSGYFPQTRHWCDNYNFPHLRRPTQRALYPYIHWNEPPHRPYFVPYNPAYSYYRSMPGELL
ncbi:hypothetical protein DdX_01806 [Ditylenchus destructor]|uniref:Uncharacterized protein n=1 Tax=Ditylenchus destructor TaxID=166010 RepID=A0AAD4RBH0_9BILA|nr:hypothetical protein DdX_01806 [Ditylenchus destructor]